MKEGDLTPLLAAMTKGASKILSDMECLEMLITRRSVTLTSIREEEALYLAIKRRDAGLVELLVRKGAPVTSSQGEVRQSVLQCAIEQGLSLEILALLSTEATANHADTKRRNSLHSIIAADSYNDTAKLAIIDMLVKHHVNVFRNDVAGNAPYDLAVGTTTKELGT